MNFANLKLNWSQNGYELYLLGLNGEPKPNCLIEVLLESELFLAC